jgi:cupin 2 domain-containing protein
MQQEFMNRIKVDNFFSHLPVDCHAEVFETIVAAKKVRIERIVSCGQSTPDGEWYDQLHDEWVLLLAGSASIMLEDGQEPQKLLPGDYLLIPARCRHRVAWTDPLQKTIWLAVHFGEGLTDGNS